MPKGVKKEKRLISVFVSTTSDEFACGEEINLCLKHLIDSPENDVRVLIQKVYYANNEGEHVTHVMVVGKGWKDGTKLFCDCLEKAGYLVQIVLADHSVIPSGK